VAMGDHDPFNFYCHARIPAGHNVIKYLKVAIPNSRIIGAGFQVSPHKLQACRAV